MVSTEVQSLDFFANVPYKCSSGTRICWRCRACVHSSEAVAITLTRAPWNSSKYLSTWTRRSRQTIKRWFVKWGFTRNGPLFFTSKLWSRTANKHIRTHESNRKWESILPIPDCLMLSRALWAARFSRNSWAMSFSFRRRCIKWKRYTAGGFFCSHCWLTLTFNFYRQLRISALLTVFFAFAKESLGCYRCVITRHMPLNRSAMSVNTCMDPTGTRIRFPCASFCYC